MLHLLDTRLQPVELDLLFGVGLLQGLVVVVVSLEFIERGLLIFLGFPEKLKQFGERVAPLLLILGKNAIIELVYAAEVNKLRANLGDELIEHLEAHRAK